MIILGIDPGTASTGYGVIKTTKGDGLKAKRCFKCLDYGIIKTTPDYATPERLKKLNNDLGKLIQKYQPEILVVENIYFFKNLKTALPVSQAKGVILLTAAKKSVPIYQFTPLQIKVAVSGYGWTEKAEIQQKVKQILKLKDIPKPDDAADALAAALAFHLYKGKVLKA